ncbi:MAG: hypothetical protein ACNYNX_03010 [Leucobacter sp.]
MEAEADRLLGRPLQDAPRFAMTMSLATQQGRVWGRQLSSLIDAIDSGGFPSGSSSRWSAPSSRRYAATGSKECISRSKRAES